MTKAPNLNLFYDFETTGLPVWNRPSSGAFQPHIVQAAGILADRRGTIISSFDLIAKPTGWEIPPNASDIHGISQNWATKVGIPEPLLVRTLWGLWKQSSLRIAHNESFDARIMRIALFRYFSRDMADEWKLGKGFCTCKKSVALARLAPTDKMMATGRKEFKNPTLAEAYEAATGKELKDAHNAMPDVLACKAVYEWINQQNEREADARE